MALIERAIAPLFEAGEESLRLHHARVLWSCYHGIVSLQVTNKIGARESTRTLTDSLIGNYVYALAHRLEDQPR